MGTPYPAIVGTSERWKTEFVDDNVGASVTVVVGAVVLVPESVAPGVSVTVDKFGAVMDMDPALVAELAAAVVFAEFEPVFAAVDWVFVSVF